jgi:hypothetical protein
MRITEVPDKSGAQRTVCLGQPHAVWMPPSDYPETLRGEGMGFALAFRNQA